MVGGGITSGGGGRVSEGGRKGKTGQVEIGVEEGGVGIREIVRLTKS